MPANPDPPSAAEDQQPPTTPPELTDEELALAMQIFDLAREGDAEALAAYVDAGVPVDLANSKGDTLLILAAYQGHEAAVSALLARGADTTRRNDRGQGALAAAVFKRSAPVVTALLAAGADPDLGSPSATETARFFDLPEMLELLTADGGSSG